MPFSIRDPRARELAKELAVRRGSTMTQAIIAALEGELARQREKRPLAERLEQLAELLKAEAGPNPREVAKDEIDAMWGQ
jgi:antitoxin VapB